MRMHARAHTRTHTHRYTGTVEDVKGFWGEAGPPPLPPAVPEVVKLALGDRCNRPINVELAMAWVLATDSRLRDRLSQPREETTRPQICHVCLGPEPTKVPLFRRQFDGSCKICSSQYTEWQFTPRTVDVRLKVRTKKTVLCLRCAQAKDVCQVCIFDMKYGLPVKLRDKLVARTGGLLPEWAVRLLPPPPAYLQDARDLARARTGETQNVTYAYGGVAMALDPREVQEEADARLAERVARLSEKLCVRGAPLHDLPASLLRQYAGSPQGGGQKGDESGGEAGRIALPPSGASQPLLIQGTAPMLAQGPGPSRNDYIQDGEPGASRAQDSEAPRGGAGGAGKELESARLMFSEQSRAGGSSSSTLSLMEDGRCGHSSRSGGILDAVERFKRRPEPASALVRQHEHAVVGVNKAGGGKDRGAGDRRLAPGTARLVKRLLGRKRAWQDQYQQNRAKVCTFWLRGACNRGVTCPFRHEKPLPSERVQMGLVASVKPVNHEESIKSRYFGHTADAVTTDILQSLLRPGEERLAPALQGLLDPGDGGAVDSGAGGGEMPAGLGRKHQMLEQGGGAGGRERRGGAVVVARWHTGVVGEDGLRRGLGVYGNIASVRADISRGVAFVKFAQTLGADGLLAAATAQGGGVDVEGVHVSLHRPG